MNRPQQKRALIVLAGLLAIAVLGRHLIRRGDALDALRHGASDAAVPAVVAPTLERGSRSMILRTARQLLEGDDGAQIEDTGSAGERLVLLSLSRSETTALVARASGDSLQQAISRAASDLTARASSAEIQSGHLKVDIALEVSAVRTFDASGRSDLDRSLDGLWLPRSDLVLMPEEILSRRLVNSDGELRAERLADYLAAGGRAESRLRDGEGQPGSPYHQVAFDSLIEGDDRLPLRLLRGNDRSAAVSPVALLRAAVAGGDYLLRHHEDSGDFGYSYEAKKDTYNDDYNLLRHAGTCYALGQLYGATGDDRYLHAARRGIDALLERAAPPKPRDAAVGFEAIVSPGREAKLGGAALAILAIVEHQQASGEPIFAERAKRLALFLVHQQDDDGRFESKYFYGKPDAKPFESIYYPGEAILALTRLYRLDPRDTWLATAKKGADWLIGVRDADKPTADLPHDHWLLMGLDELDRLTGEPRYRAHAARIAEAIVTAQRTGGEPIDWIGSFYNPPRSTPTATRAEGLVAMYHLARRAGMETQPYLDALRRMATFQRRCQLTPENVLYLPRPDRSLGGFRRSLTNWEVRIDYVQHNLSALLGLRSILLELSRESPGAE